MDSPYHDDSMNYEFERKFLVHDLPYELIAEGRTEVIAQAYLFAEEGYAVRVRLTFPQCILDFPQFHDEYDFKGTFERRCLRDLLNNVDTSRDDHGIAAQVAVKSPAVRSSRYEAEMAIDIDVAVQILRRSVNIILKNRHTFWVHSDPWQIDVFGGQNDGLMIAECERLAPVEELTIPHFCVTEVTEDLRFTNDHLSKVPWRQWCDLYYLEFAARGPHFME